MFRRFVFVFFFLLVMQTLYAGKFGLKLAAEGGTHHFEKQGSEALVRFSAALKFKQRFQQQYLNLQARLTPEIIGINGSASSMKFSGNLQTGRTCAQGGWEAGLRAKNYFYQLSTDNSVYFSVADFSVSGFYLRQGSTFYFGRLNYLYRDLDTQPANHLDAFRGAGGLMFNGWSKMRLQILFDSERFRISTRQQKRINTGWRAGPEIIFHYQAKVFIHSTLRLLYHYSDLSKKAGRDIQAQIVFGKFLTPRLSLFAYLDYRLIRLGQSDLPVELLYSAVDNENWYYLKLDFEPLRRFAVYAKAGYFKDSLPRESNTLSGMQVLIGLSWKAL